MINELTGLVMDENKDIFIASASGTIIRMEGNSLQLSDPKLPQLIRSKLSVKPTLPKFEFHDNHQYATAHGIRFEPATYFPLIPRLLITPDAQMLLYQIKDSLFLIEPNSLNIVRRIGITGSVYDMFITKESGDWVVNLLLLNDSMFPLAKKYSLNKLSQPPTPKIESEISKQSILPSKRKENSSKLESDPSSLADELKKLKELKDQGILTEEEFKAAKNKVLNNPNPKK